MQENQELMKLNLLKFNKELLILTNKLIINKELLKTILKYIISPRVHISTSTYKVVKETSLADWNHSANHDIQEAYIEKYLH